MGGRLNREGIYIYIYICLKLIHVAVQQKLIQHSKAIIPKFKKINGKKEEYKIVVGWEGGEWLENKEEIVSRQGRGGSHPGKDVGFYPDSKRRVCIRGPAGSICIFKDLDGDQVEKKSEGVRNDERRIH